MGNLSSEKEQKQPGLFQFIFALLWWRRAESNRRPKYLKTGLYTFSSYLVVGSK